MIGLLVILAGLCKLHLAQVPTSESCFDPLPVMSPTFMAKGDIFEMELGSYSQGDNILYEAQLKIGSDELHQPLIEDPAQNLHNWDHSGDFDFSKCTKHVQSKDSPDLLYYFCNSSQIVVLDISMGKNKVIVRKSAVLPSSILNISDCSDMQLNPITSRLDIICLDRANFSIYYLEYDLQLILPQSPTEFPQEKVSYETLKGPLSMFYLNEAGVGPKELVIMIYESFQNKSRLVMKCLYRDPMNTAMMHSWNISPQLGNFINFKSSEPKYLFAIFRYDLEQFGMVIGGESMGVFMLAKMIIPSRTISCDTEVVEKIVLPSTDLKTPMFHLISHPERSEVSIYTLADRQLHQGVLKIQKTIRATLTWYPSNNLTLDESGVYFAHLDAVYDLKDQVVFLGKRKLSTAAKHDMGLVVKKFSNRRTLFTWPEEDSGFGIVLAQYKLQHSDLLIRSSEKRLISLTRLDEPGLRWSSEGFPDAQDPQITILVSCKPMLGADIKPAQRELSFEIFKTVNQKFDMTLYSMKFYFGTDYITLPVNGNRINGNAPLVQGLPSSDPVHIRVDSILNRTIVFDDFNSVHFASDFLGVGQRFILLWNSSVLKLAECNTSRELVDIECKVNPEPLMTDRVKQLKMVDALMFKEYLVIAVSIPKHLVLIKILEEDTTVQGKLEWPIYFDFGKLKVNEDFLDLFLVGAVWQTPMIKQFFVFETDKVFNTSIAEMKPIFTFGSQICPISMTLIPRTKIEFDFLSYCVGDLHSFSHRYLYDPENKLISRFVVAADFPPLQIEKVQMCSTNTAMVLVDLHNHMISAQSVDTEEISFTYRAPLQEYGMDTIVSVACDSKKRLLQIIAANKTTNQKKLILYRPDEFFNPFRRVHVVTEVPSWAVYTALIDAGIDDQLTSLLICTNRNNMQFYNVLTDSPQITLNLRDVKHPGNYTISYNVTFPGKIAVSRTLSHVLELQEYKPEFSTSLVSVHKTKQKVVDGFNLNLEQLVDIKGVFLGVESPEPNIFGITDRYVQTYYPRPVTKSFQFSCGQDGLIFGFSLIDPEQYQAGVTVELINADTGSLLYAYNASQIISIKCLTKLDPESGFKKPFFFAMLADDLGNNMVKIVHSFNKDVTGIPTVHPTTPASKWPGSAWRLSTLKLNVDGIIKAVFEDCEGPRFTLVTFSSKYGYQLDLATISFSEERLETFYTAGEPHTTKDAVSYIDNLGIGTSVVMFYTEQKNLSLVVRYYEMDELTQKLECKKSDSISLEANNKFLFGINHIFECILTNRNQNLTLVKCVFIDQGTESHQVDLLLDTSLGLDANLIQKGMLGFSLSNLPDFQPYCVDYADNLISLVGFSTAAGASYGQHMVILFDPNDATESDVPVHPHKIFETSLIHPDLFHTAGLNIAQGVRLSAGIFKNNQNQLTVHINNPTKAISYMHFKPSNLTLSIKKLSKLDDDSHLIFKLPQGKTQKLYLREFIDIENSLMDFTTLKEQRKFLFVVCLVGFGIIALLIALHYFSKEKSTSMEMIEAMFDTHNSQIGEVTTNPSIYDRGTKEM